MDLHVSIRIADALERIAGSMERTELVARDEANAKTVLETRARTAMECAVYFESCGHNSFGRAIRSKYGLEDGN